MKTLALLSCLLLSQSLWAAWFSDERPIMGTRVAVQLEASEAAEGQAAIAAVMAEMRRIEARFSPMRDDSELSALNANAARAAVVVSPEMYSLLERAQAVSELSEGAFDLTFASVGRYYDYRKGDKPDAEKLAALKSAIDYRKLQLDKAARSVRFLHPAIYLDLGGIAKGYAVDQAIALLREHGITNAVVSAGGDSRAIGRRNGKAWTVGIQDPRKPDAMAVVMPLEDSAFSTSGDYERYFVEGGVRYHHIIDPDTGDSARELRSVTVLAEDATTSDALSTTVFVLGRQKGLAFINRLPGIDAILIDQNGHLHYSSGLLRQK